ncbi:MAG: shikimate dehydrogenase [Legionellales bacterium]|nr:shikimate dehydrogenase [Legionellales bacterium]
MFHRDTYAVIGWPLNHSLSPQIHQYFAKQTDQDIDYLKLPLSPIDLQKGFTDFFAQGGQGVNITVPYKEIIIPWLDKCSSECGAVNTVYWDEHKKLTGENTDGAGFYYDLIEHQHVEIADKRILICGAGGAVQGILPYLIAAKPECIFIANRNVDRLTALATRFQPTDFTYGDYNNIPAHAFDIVINATSASLFAENLPLPKTCVTPNSLAYDLAYSNTPTSFLMQMQNYGVKHRCDGFGMLVEQAARAFLRWRGVKPDTKMLVKNRKNAIQLEN